MGTTSTVGGGTAVPADMVNIARAAARVVGIVVLLLLLVVVVARSAHATNNTTRVLIRSSATRTRGKIPKSIELLVFLCFIP